MSHLFQRSLIVGVCLFSSSWSYAAIKEYHLTIEENWVNLTGKPVKRVTVNGQFPAPLLEFEEGDDAVIHVHNKLKNQDSSIHWHGLLLPGLMDGVPGFNQFKGIRSGETFRYAFKIRQNGTYWYHAHSKGQEQDGLYGALVIYPKGKQVLADHEKTARDYVVMLSDFHEKSSAQIQKDLKISAEFYQNQRETLGDVWKKIKRDGLKATWSDRSMWNSMRMLKTDLSDVTGYTFLINGQTPQQNWTGLFKPNEKLRLRFINASAMSFFDVRIPKLKMTVVAADGQPVQPVAVDEFRIGTAETYDVLVEPHEAHYQIEAESIDRSGFAIGSLHNEQKVNVHGIHMPEARPRAILSMGDMGHGHDTHTGSAHSEHNPSSKSDAVQMSHGNGNPENKGSHDHHEMQPNVEHHSEKSQPVEKHAHHDAQNYAENYVKNSAQNNAPNSYPTQNIAESTMQPTLNHSMHHHTEAQNTALSTSHAVVEGWANASTPVGDKALQYSDLKSLTPQTDTREPTSELVIRLGGTMERYIWTINGKKFSEAEPLQVKYGERIRIKFINESMMAHPMHLHGMFMQLENGQPAVDMPNKHTIVVPPAKTVTALLTANELGEWAIHCHLLYHMSAGMMNKLIVAQVADEDHATHAHPQTDIEADNVQQGDEHAHH